MNNPINSFLLRIRIFRHLDPERDWLVLLILSMIVLVGIVLWNVWVFSTVASGGVIGLPVATSSPAFSQSSLDTIHTIFSNRSDEEAKYVSGAYRYADPSL